MNLNLKLKKYKPTAADYVDRYADLTYMENLSIIHLEESTKRERRNIIIWASIIWLISYYGIEINNTSNGIKIISNIFIKTLSEEIIYYISFAILIYQAFQYRCSLLHEKLLSYFYVSKAIYKLILVSKRLIGAVDEVDLLKYIHQNILNSQNSIFLPDEIKKSKAKVTQIFQESIADLDKVCNLDEEFGITISNDEIRAVHSNCKNVISCHIDHLSSCIDTVEDSYFNKKNKGNLSKQNYHDKEKDARQKYLIATFHNHHLFKLYKDRYYSSFLKDIILNVALPYALIFIALTQILIRLNSNS